MTLSRLLSLACLMTACWIAAASNAEACSCATPLTTVARDSSIAVFEGTVVDGRITLVNESGLWVAAPEQEIVVGRVWKGDVTSTIHVLYLNAGMCSGAAPVGMTALFFLTSQAGRLAYGMCLPTQPIGDAAPALAALGPPIATFADRVPEVTVAATMPASRRLRAIVAVGAAYYLNVSAALFEYHPLRWGHALLLCVLLAQCVAATIFMLRRRVRRSLLLCATSALTLAVLLVWTGHALASRPEVSYLLLWP
jgi:hypothetical protein